MSRTEKDNRLARDLAQMLVRVGVPRENMYVRGEDDPSRLREMLRKIYGTSAADTTTDDDEAHDQ
jgi:hypothetical protein